MLHYVSEVNLPPIYFAVFTPNRMKVDSWMVCTLTAPIRIRKEARSFKNTRADHYAAEK